jgi:predicted Holliday junction resolvase-like endonuclease
MTALVIVLILAVLVLAALLVATRRALKREQRLLDSREAQMSDHRQRVTEATATAERSQADMHHVQAELHEARLQIVALEQRRDALEADAGEEAGRRSLFRRSSSEIHPEAPEQEQRRLSRG